MKSRFNFFPIVLLLVSVFSLTSCTEFVNKIVENMAKETLDFEQMDSAKWGKVIEKELDLTSFNSIKTKGKVCIILSQDSAYYVRVRSNEKCVEAYKYEVKKGELRIEHKDFKGNVGKNTPPVTLYISVPDLKEVELTGAGKLHVQGTMEQTESLDIEVSGAGQVDIDTLSVKSMKVELSGASNCKFAKVVAEQDIEIEVNGAGDINANVFCEDLEVEINGAGNVVLGGECKNHTFTQAGAAKIDSSNLKK